MREEQPALTSLIMHLFCDYFAYGRGYNSKFAEDQKKVPENTDKTVVLAGNYLIDEPRKLIKLPSGNLCVPTVVDDDLHLNSIVDNSSSTNLDGKDKHDNRQNGLAESLSVAFNAVGDLLK